MISRVIFVIDAVTFEIVTAFLIYLFFDTNFLKGVSAPLKVKQRFLHIFALITIVRRRWVGKSHTFMLKSVLWPFF